MLHDEFLSVAKKLDNFLQNSLEDFFKTDDNSRCFAVAMSFSKFGGDFMAVAKKNGIVPNEQSPRDIKDLAHNVKDLAQSLDKEQGMDDVDFRRDIQLTVNKLAANGIS